MLCLYIRSVRWCRRCILSSLAWPKEAYQQREDELKLAREARLRFLSKRLRNSSLPYALSVAPETSLA
jgi:hypothetical protein